MSDKTSPSEDKKTAASYKPTPMMEQFLEIKGANPDSLLFYRMGDFYELFFDDAVQASKALGITLTKRGKHLGEDIPMCGVPVHAADGYLDRLIALGYKVSVCEQTEDPAEAKKRGAKSVVRRDVVRLVTPGTLTEESLLDSGSSNYLASVSRVKNGDEGHLYGLSWLELSTGDFGVLQLDHLRLGAELARLDPREIIVSDHMLMDEDFQPLKDMLRTSISPVPRAFFDGSTAADRLMGYFGLSTLDGYGHFERVELMAASAVLAYVEKTQLGARPPLNPPQRELSSRTMSIDAATRANLELVRTLSGDKKGSLLSVIDKTVTGGGSRLLAARLAAPLAQLDGIIARQNSIAWFLQQTGLREDLREGLKAAPDMPRALSRLSLDRGGPRDLGAIRSGFSAIFALLSHIGSAAQSEPLPQEIGDAATALQAMPEMLGQSLSEALNDELPLQKRDGGFVRTGYDAGLDELRSLRDESRRVIASLQADYANETGIKALKVKHNNVLGYFLEVTANNADKMMSAPLNERFIHRQTLANAVRFTTTELADLEARIASAGAKVIAIELSIFDRLRDQVLAAVDLIQKAARALATLDVSTALACLADEQNYCRPLMDDSLAFEVSAGRHPVVELALSRDGGDPFVANDCDLSPQAGHDNGRIWLMTGPNMAGKSTYLRQNALIAILAQMGSFVPADQAHIGLVDRLFSRVGAADDLARGRSTFMVEMVETAAILNQAGERSLVILDEIGRGTSTFDGLSIAWATIESLHEVNRSRALFATHYHELTVLHEKLPRLNNATVKVKEWQGDVVFLHEIVPGAADRSYGIQVAKLAGLPDVVINRARDVLESLEEGDRQSPALTIDDLPLFSATAQKEVNKETDFLRDALNGINPDDMSPREAQQALYRLKGLV
ncbi:DNA mismatch repair protein MutS [Cohaesibacter celericrescens]|uniref:DNA mismatch repair protein MutS n=1 Tax=Cohaesibacter celericrescens TaxID=2067669 RepID=A0A2N5XP07_9HYPH|nr:DNA mismatch repair protein MutS [Cohaesibacter celericrescens]PLW76157.1 DNA mismatch repair protein MutS [Cohaesibacter celericrescens]